MLSPTTSTTGEGLSSYFVAAGFLEVDGYRFTIRRADVFALLDQIAKGPPPSFQTVLATFLAHVW